MLLNILKVFARFLKLRYFALKLTKTAQKSLKFYNFHIKLYNYKFIVLFTIFKKFGNTQRFATFIFRAYYVQKLMLSAATAGI